VSSTAVYVFGARRPTYGTYEIVLDGGSSVAFDGHADPPLYRQLLFAATGLDSREHKIVRELKGFFQMQL
jgi:hypothetical protein